MIEVALVSMSLCYNCKLIVPLHYLHIRGWWLRSWRPPLLFATSQFGAKPVVYVDNLLLLPLCDAPGQWSPTALGAETLVLAHGVLWSDAAVVLLAPHQR